MAALGSHPSFRTNRGVAGLAKKHKGIRQGLEEALNRSGYGLPQLRVIIHHKGLYSMSVQQTRVKNATYDCSVRPFLDEGIVENGPQIRLLSRRQL